MVDLSKRRPISPFKTWVPASHSTGQASFLAQALQKDDWQEIEFSFGNEPTQKLTRNEAQAIVRAEVNRLTGKLTNDEQIKLQDAFKDLKNNGQSISQAFLTKYLQERGFSVNSQTQNFIQAYQQRLSISSNHLPATDQLETAIQARQQWDNQFCSKIAQTVAQNLPFGYSPALKQQRIREISQQVETLAGRQLQAGKPLDENFSRYVYQAVSRPLAWQAAIANPRQFQQGLGEVMAGAAGQENSLTRSYNNLRNFQMTVDPRYWQMAQWLNEKNLSVPEIERVVTFVQQRAAMGAGSWEVEHELRTVLKRYPQTEKDAATLAQRSSLYLSRQTLISAKTQKLAQKFKTKNLSAVQLYCRYGWTAAQLEKEGFDDLAKQVNELSKNAGAAKEHQKTLENKEKTEKEFDKRLARTQKRQEWRQSMATQNIGWQNFKGTAVKFTPGYWVNRGYRTLMGKFGGWLEQKGFHQAAQAIWGNPLLGKAGGFKALASHLFRKIGGGKLLALAGGPVGTALAGLAAVLQNKQLRELAAQLLFGAGYLLYYLISHFGLALGMGAVGFAVGGPIGFAAGFAAGFALQKIISSLGGLSQSIGSALASGATTIGNSLGSLSLTTMTPQITTITVVSVIVPILAVILFSILSFMNTISAMTLPPQTGTGGGVDQIFPPRELPAAANCGLACDLARILNKPHCGAGQVTSGTLNPALACIMNDPDFNIDSPARQLVADEIQRSVNSLGTLHCVGFKKAVEPALRSYNQNAVAFIYNHPGSIVTSPQVGDNAVWGPRASCKDSAGKAVTDPQQANALCDGNLLACCGHIGIVTDTAGAEIGITSAWGDTGTVNTIYLPAGSTKEDGGPWIFFRP